MVLKTRSDLPTSVLFLLLAVGLDLVVLIFVLTILTSRVGMEYGYEIKSASSRYVMNVSPDAIFLSVTAGEKPEFFIGNRRIDGGMSGVSRELDHLVKDAKDSNSERVTIVLNLDGTVSRYLEQDLVDLVLSKGMNCAIAAGPKYNY